MELNYYISQSNIPNSIILYSVLYGSGFYNFSTNLSSNSYYDDALIDSNIEDYTFFLTYEKLSSTSQILLSSYSTNRTGSNDSGYTIGINSSNELFVDYPKEKFCGVFNIKVANKACICIKKVSNILTIYKYDIVSGVIEGKDSITLPGEISDINLNPIFIGGSDEYVLLPQNLSSIYFFSGTIDQLLVVTEGLDESLINTIFKGFRPETLTPLVESTYKKSENYFWNSDSLEQYKAYFSDYFNSIDLFLFTGNFRSGYSVGLEEGVFMGQSGNGFEIDISYYTGISGSCSLGDAVPNVGLSGKYYYVDLPLSLPNYSYSGQLEVIKYSDRMSIVRKIYLSTGSNQYNFVYNAGYYSNSTTTGYSSSFSKNYYTGFKMNGVWSDTRNLYGLFSGQKIEPTGYNRLGEYNFTNNSFYIPEYSPTGTFYLDGNISTGVISNNFIYFTSGSSDKILSYDNNINYSLLGISSKNYNISNSFYQRASKVIDENLKMLNLNDYIETCKIDLIHGKLIQKTGALNIFEL